MFLTSPDLDLFLIIAALIVAVIISLAVGLVKKNFQVGAFCFSLLGNGIFLMNMGSDFYRFYNLEWLLYFSLYLWPVINIFWIVFYIKNRK